MDETKFVRTPLVLKAEKEGDVEAVFSTFDVVDKDGDIVLPSAFVQGQAVPLVWHHDWTRPVGKGVIHVEPTRAVFKGAFFLNTEGGQEAYRTVKAMGELQQYSWGFRIRDAAYEERDGEWIRIIKRAEVYEVSPVLVGAGEGTRTLSIKSGQPLAEQAEAALAAVQDLAARMQSLADLRAKEGRTLSEANWQRLSKVKESLDGVSADLGELLAATEKPKVAVAGLYAEYLKTIAAQNGVAV